jgi:hypothetical protein
MSNRSVTLRRMTTAAAVVSLGIALAAFAADVPRPAPAGETEAAARSGVPSDDGGAPRVEQQNGISYVSGGVGRDEANALDRIGGKFNLKLTMAMANGEFTSPVSLRIEDPHGATVLDIRPNGPMLLAALPPGDYVIHATAEGQSLTRKAAIPAHGQEQVSITWPAQAGHAPDDGY